MSSEQNLTAQARKVIDEFKSLPPDEQLVARDEVVSLTRARHLEALERLRGVSRDEDLLAALLADRTKERAGA